MDRSAIGVPLVRASNGLWCDLIQRVFYEGQILFLEDMYNSAEVKFTIVLAMTSLYDFLSYESTSEKVTIVTLISTMGPISYCNRIKVAALTNIVSCRLKRFMAKSKGIDPQSSQIEPILSEDRICEATVSIMLNSNALELCDYAYALCSEMNCLESNVTLILCRKVDVLEEMKYYRKCLEIIERLEHHCTSEKDVSQQESLFVQSYRPDSIFSQKFIFKEYPDDENYFETLLTYIEKRKSRIVYLMESKL